MGGAKHMTSPINFPGLSSPKIALQKKKRYGITRESLCEANAERL